METIHSAARRGNLNRVKELLNQGVPVNTQTSGAGWTPLHDAADSGRLSVVQELLRRGAHLNPRTRSGMTPHYVAAFVGHLNIVRELLQHGANVNARTRLNETPLHAAAASGHLNIVRELLQHGANINARTHAGSTPLHIAAFCRHPHVVQALQEAGARVNTAGRTVTRDAAAVRAPNYSKASKHLKKWLEARPHEIRMNQVNVKLPEGASDPISLKNFNKGNEAIMVLKKDVRNGALRTKRYFLEKNVLARLAKKPWRSILRMKASDAVFKDPINRRTVYRRNLMNVKFI